MLEIPYEWSTNELEILLYHVFVLETSRKDPSSNLNLKRSESAVKTFCTGAARAREYIMRTLGEEWFEKFVALLIVTEKRQ